MVHDREVGGIRCTEVLAHLSDYLDGEASPELRERIEAHLRGCDWCERFGGAFASVIRSLRAELTEPQPLPGEQRERLRRTLRRRLQSEPGPAGDPPA